MDQMLLETGAFFLLTSFDTIWNIFSIRSGVASHDFIFRTYRPRVLEWSLYNQNQQQYSCAGSEDVNYSCDSLKTTNKAIY